MRAARTDTARLTAAFRRLGCRDTVPRRKITELVAGMDGSFTVESVSRGLPGIGRATVYRTIRLLVAAGALCRLSMPDGTPAYSVARTRHHHHHAVCVRCGAVDPFDSPEIERALQSAGERIAGEVVGHLMEFYVNCRACASEASAAAERAPGEGKAT